MNETKCYIIAAGDFPADEDLLNKIANAPYLICCDGAVRIVEMCGIEPDAIVGDGDSIPSELKQKYAERYHQVADQETNDLTKAVDFAISIGRKDIIIFGATGLREDHTLGNISLLMDYMDKVDSIMMVSDYGMFIPYSKTAKFPSKQGTQISIFNFGSSQMSASGLRYPLRGFDKLWQGTLNESIADRVEIEADGKFLVYICCG